MDCSPPGSSVHGIFQAGILEWVAISSSGDLPHPGIEPVSPELQVDSLLEEMKQKVQEASDAAIAKKEKVIKHIRSN